MNANYDFLIDYFALQRAVGEYDILMTEEDRADMLKRLTERMANVRKRYEQRSVVSSQGSE